MARELRESSAGPDRVDVTPAITEAHELRDRLGMLLQERMQRVRSAARFVFRGHPELLRQVTSSYERRQRATQRHAKAEDAAPSSPANGGVVA